MRTSYRLYTTATTRSSTLGAAEGYYAVGLALKSPASTVYAFEIDHRARRLCRKMARANAVSNLVVDSACDATRLASIPSRTFIVCDCEGAELEILRPDLAPPLRQPRFSWSFTSLSRRV